jgi:hypothetical protein
MVCGVGAPSMRSVEALLHSSVVALRPLACKCAQEVRGQQKVGHMEVTPLCHFGLCAILSVPILSGYISATLTKQCQIWNIPDLVHGNGWLAKFYCFPLNAVNQADTH